MSTLNEFGLIHRFFNQTAPEGYIGVGDDCAVFSVRPGFQLAVSTDTLIEGQHFFSEANPYSLGHKALAVNLSDLSAMGAKPTGCVLALAIPAINTAWLDSFSSGFLDLAKQSGCPLIGGDTTRNPHGIVLTITVFGEVPVAHALRRDRAQPGDDIWLTGTLGGPDLALQYLSGRLALDARRLELCRDTLEHPNPPFAFAPNLLEHAHAAIDISDGLLQDLSHILQASHCGATLNWADLPVHPALDGLPVLFMQQAVLTGGDVFQLCFTAPPSQRAYLFDTAAKQQVSLHRIGSITAEPGLRVLDHQHQAITLPAQGGFDHFAI